MERSVSLVILLGSFFVALFFLSIITPNDVYTTNGKVQVDDTQLIAQYGEMEDEIKAEQQKYYRSRAEDEENYYRQVTPKENDDPSYFERSHPLEEAPLEEEGLQEMPLEERPLQEEPLEERLLR